MQEVILKRFIYGRKFSKFASLILKKKWFGNDWFRAQFSYLVCLTLCVPVSGGCLALSLIGYVAGRVCNYLCSWLVMWLIIYLAGWFYEWLTGWLTMWLPMQAAMWVASFVIGGYTMG